MAASAITDRLGKDPATAAWQPTKAMLWYDGIIDWIFSHPGGNLKECAADLGKSPTTIRLIVRSDIFKARYAQRRIQFNEDLDHRIVGKLAQVAEKSLDHILTTLDKKRDQVPLPVLKDLARDAMDRLGYSPSRPDSAAAQVHVHNHVNASSNTAVLPSSVTPDALARARAHLRTLQEGSSPAPLLEVSGKEVPAADPEPPPAGGES
jgi:hypothetical protein